MVRVAPFLTHGVDSYALKTVILTYLLIDIGAILFDGPHMIPN